MNRTHFHFHFHFHSARWLSTLPYLTALTSRRVLSLKGPQVTPFLQNLITNEIQSLTKPKCSAIYTAFLSSQGRYLLDGFLSLHPSFPQTYLLDVHHHHLPLAISHLRRYNLRGLVEIQETPLSIWFAWKPPSCPTTTSFDSNSTVPFPTVLTYTDPRIQKLGVRYLLQKDVMPKILSQFQLVSEEDYILYKYKQGVPEGSDFISHVSLPLEVNLDFLNGVNFHKGCYLGQELTIRTHHTGVVRKRMVPMMLEASSTDQEQKQWEFPKLTEVLTEQGRAAGKLYVGQGTFGLGLIRLEFLNQPLRVAEKPWVQLKAWKPDWWPNQTLHS